MTNTLLDFRASMGFQRKIAAFSNWKKNNNLSSTEMKKSHRINNFLPNKHIFTTYLIAWNISVRKSVSMSCIKKKKKLHSGRKKSNLSLTHTHFLYKTVVWSFMCTSSENWIPSVCNQVNSLRQVQTCFNNRLYYHTHMIQSHKKETIHSQW